MYVYHVKRINLELLITEDHHLKIKLYKLLLLITKDSNLRCLPQVTNGRMPKSGQNRRHGGRGEKSRRPWRGRGGRRRRRVAEPARRRPELHLLSAPAPRLRVAGGDSARRTTPVPRRHPSHRRRPACPAARLPPRQRRRRSAAAARPPAPHQLNPPLAREHATPPPGLGVLLPPPPPPLLGLLGRGTPPRAAERELIVASRPSLHCRRYATCLCFRRLLVVVSSRRLLYARAACLLRAPRRVAECGHERAGERKKKPQRTLHTARAVARAFAFVLTSSWVGWVGWS